MITVKIVIAVEDEHADEGDSTGLTTKAYEKLTDPFGAPLQWLGEIQDVEMVSIGPDEVQGYKLKSKPVKQ